MLWPLLIVFIVTILFWALKRRSNYWKDRGVKQSNGRLLGDNFKAFMRKQAFTDMTVEAYNMHPKTRYSGFYQFFSPTLIIKDPDLIKQIGVKDFENFMNHMSLVPEDGDPTFSKNLFSLKNEKWRNMRSTMSPAFTSSKMKCMFSLISQSAEQFVQSLIQQKEQEFTVELKDIFTKFTNDIIANVAFGFEINSLAQPENEFYVMGKELTDFSSIIKILRFFGYLLVPKLYTVFKISPFSKTTVQFFTNIVQDNIDSRRKEHIVRPDMINILLQAQNQELKHEELANTDTGFATAEESETNKNSKFKIQITDHDIVAQAIAFFFAGFETVSGHLCFLFYELGVNPDIQQKLIEEIDKTYETCDGKITYESLLSMKYLDMVISETLRKWPNVIVVDRVCSKPYSIERKYPDERTIYLEKDAMVWIPVFAIHRDPQYYPEPDKFNPERFSDENKSKIKPYTYMPFGIGPRSCIGSRLALLETKALVFYILANFKIIPNDKTPMPLRICKKQINLTAEGGFWFDLRKRTDKM